MSKQVEGCLVDGERRRVVPSQCKKRIRVGAVRLRKENQKVRYAECWSLEKYMAVMAEKDNSNGTLCERGRPTLKPRLSADPKKSDGSTQRV